MARHRSPRNSHGRHTRAGRACALTDHRTPRRNVAVVAPTATFRSNALLGALAVGAVTVGPGVVMASSDGAGPLAGPESSTRRAPQQPIASPAALTIEMPTTTAAAPDPVPDLQALQKGEELARVAAERAAAEQRAAEERAAAEQHAAEERAAAEARAAEERRLAELGGANCPSSGFGGVVPHVARAGHHLQDKFGVDDVGGVASRPNNPTSDHPSGHALDFMVDTATGNALAAYARAHAEELGIKYVLWQVADHYDHVHISFTSSGARGLPC